MATKKKLSAQITRLEKAFAALEKQHAGLLDALPASQVDSARNLLRYVAFRSFDIRHLQDDLHEAGLSSLASSESHILAQLQNVQMHLGKNYTPEELDNSSYRYGKQKITKHSQQLFGAGRKNPPFLMVTFDNTFMDDIEFIEELLRAGMTVARINCAHDDEKVWLEMINNLKQACRNSKRTCKIYMDLSGPKIRTVILGKGKKKGKVELREGDKFYLAEKNLGFASKKVVLGCTYPGIIDQLKADEPVLFDDGEVEVKVLSVADGLAELKVLRNSKNNKSLKAEKGMNFPESQLEIIPLTPYDEECIPFICEHADLIGYSFVKHPSDVALLQQKIGECKHKPAIILKIETPEAVKQLPLLLLQGMQQEALGVMIARGDLAVELGFERMSEVQDQILWFCEAGHVPVIWATQVLETLHKTGIATRSEMTDAVHAAAADCIMLNKGDYTLEVMDTLQDVISRSKGHSYKKRYISRPLHIAINLMEKKDWGLQVLQPAEEA